MEQNYDANLTLVSSSNWTTNITSDPLPLTHYDSAGLMFSWGPLTGTLTTTSFDIEVSNDSSNWAQIGSTVSVGTNASGTDAVSLSDLFFTYIRVKANVGSVSAGPVKATITLKR